MATHAGAPDDCLLVRHWVLLGEKSIPKETRWAPGEPASPAGRARWLRHVGDGGGSSDQNIRSALPVQYGGDAAVDAVVPGARGGAILGVGWGATTPLAARSCLQPCHPTETGLSVPVPFLCRNWQRHLAMLE